MARPKCVDCMPVEENIYCESHLQAQPQDGSPDEGSQLSAQTAPRRRSSLGRRRMSRMMSFSGAAEARRKSRAKSICLAKLQPHEAALLVTMEVRTTAGRTILHSGERR
ncbi:hypothetical protein V5799_031751 [Amblyomma americanum]|uniref:Uncharacterized protein n=1 Tax=Amblyomma americanum TaxID=6943 RepID=A0AAQ4DT49_AMBAM